MVPRRRQKRGMLAPLKTLLLHLVVLASRDACCQNPRSAVVNLLPPSIPLPAQCQFQLPARVARSVGCWSVRLVIRKGGVPLARSDRRRSTDGRTDATSMPACVSSVAVERCPATLRRLGVGFGELEWKRSSSARHVEFPQVQSEVSRPGWGCYMADLPDLLASPLPLSPISSPHLATETAHLDGLAPSLHVRSRRGQ